jgi:Uma2 family endonuclease
MRRLRAWLSLPDEDRAELINGQIVYKAMPTIAHGSAIMALGGNLRDADGGSAGQGGGGWWLSTDADLFLAGQGMRPDAVGWQADRYPRLPEKVNVGEHLGVYVAVPDWVCEVLSPSTRDRDELDGTKGKAYFRAGVSHYWLIDLDAERILVHRRGERAYDEITQSPLRPGVCSLRHEPRRRGNSGTYHKAHFSCRCPPLRSAALALHRRRLA